MPISMLRDGWTCQYCGDKFRTQDLTFDHVLPRSKGGLSEWENIVTACRPCNCKKGSKLCHEANMHPITLPVRPNLYQLQKKGGITLKTFCTNRGWTLFTGIAKSHRKIDEPASFYHPMPMERVLGERAKALEDFVIRGIEAFNEERCGIQSNYEPIDIEIRNSAGKLVAGVHAESYLDVTMVHILFAAERGKGHGQKLMQEVERISRATGRRHIILDSFSFQAPDFYKQKLGFKEFGVVEDHTPGFRRHYLVKHLT